MSGRVRWFEEARFGMFVHWGLYSLLEGSYGGRTLPDPSLPHGRSWYAEWIQPRLEVPPAEYQALRDRFNPVGFDADEWILEAKLAGMRYFTITAKHHDGFQLWDSQVSDFSIAATPYGRDLLGDLASACRKHGVKLGFYYSHWQDWYHKGGAMPQWDGVPQPTQDQFEEYWQTISLPHVQELIDRYDPDLLWFDTWDDEAKGWITPQRRDQLVGLIRGASDKCLINGRICAHDPGDDIDFLEMGDNEHPERNQGRPWQTPATMQHTWGWHANDFNWKSSRELIGLLCTNVSLGGNYLLNVGPLPDGRFPGAAVRRLREVGGWLAGNGEAVYGAEPSDVAQSPDVRWTMRDLADGSTRHYALVIGGEVSELTAPWDPARLTECVVLDTGQPVEYTSGAEGCTTIRLPAQVASVSVPAIAMRVAPAK